MLKVDVVEAVELRSMSLSGTLDPYAVLQVEDQ